MVCRLLNVLFGIVPVGCTDTCRVLIGYRDSLRETLGLHVSRRGASHRQNEDDDYDDDDDKVRGVFGAAGSPNWTSFESK